MTELWRLGVDDASQALADGSLSSVELVQSSIERIAATDPHVHAWAFVDADAALAQARRSDARRRAGNSRGPMDGIPVGVKDVIDVAGMPTRGGSESLADAGPAERDAVAVARLRDAGGVLLGKAHTYEFAFGQGQPPTLNPRDPARYAGGSSIGSGVAVAVGDAPAMLGTDTGGSIRNPASVNGIVGLKSSAGLVSTEGAITISRTMDAIGPLTASALGCALVLDAIADPAARDRAFGGSVADSALRPPVGPLRIGVDRALWSLWGVGEPVRTAIDESLARLADTGAEIVELDLSFLDAALTAGLVVSLSESVPEHRSRLRAAAVEYLPGTRVMIATGALIDPADVRLALRVRHALRRRIERALSDADLTAIAAPTLPAGAPLLATMASELTDAGDDESLGSALRMLSAANLTGLPGLGIPSGEPDGRPAGMHLLGRMFGDAELIAVARRLESISPWRARVPLDPVISRAPDARE
ncbi:amidase [Microbacterium arabinogalactanolyticum]|uniref:amidase n=1 Tax=Microbacterium arabinogalactanolyticum TaxID=69365 RepID=UPI002554AAF3|nr:amidase [Microbacterium arabinogalactanolyticum]GLC85179.1 amidase [Microbacterium arabinogalactanolyticum]